MVKARIRQIRLERSRKRMIAAIPEATVVITNPTHYAVALKYEIRQDGRTGLRREGCGPFGAHHP
jgi:flagellar biosynthesis protein FlhB